MGKIKFDKRNFRKHSESNKAMIRKSLSECGAGRSVVIDADDELIAGNGVFEQASALGLGVKVVETDGSELVVVKRTDLHTEDEKRKKLAMADNATSDNVEWDFDVLGGAFSTKELADWNIKLPSLTETERLSKLEYTGTYYEPKNMPNIKLDDCYDLTKFKAKVDAIEAMDLPDETKNVLRVFAYRFIKIDFESVANYYAFNASEQEKVAIERLRLVLVDNGLDGFIEDDMLKVHEIMLEGEGDGE